MSNLSLLILVIAVAAVAELAYIAYWVQRQAQALSDLMRLWPALRALNRVLAPAAAEMMPGKPATFATPPPPQSREQPAVEFPHDVAGMARGTFREPAPTTDEVAAIMEQLNGGNA